MSDPPKRQNIVPSSMQARYMEVIQMAKITPLLLGVGGDSGTGKSPCAGGIYKIFGPVPEPKPAEVRPG